MNNTIDIYSKGAYPADALSNFYPHSFTLDGVNCASMEGFLQSLKYRSAKKQLEICALVGKEAKKAGSKKFLWKLSGHIYWQGKRYKRTGEQFGQLLLRAYRELYNQNKHFRDALNSTEGTTLRHTRGEDNPRKTILTEREFISCLRAVRGD